VPPIDIHQLFLGIGLDKRVIDSQQLQCDTSTTKFILLLLLEWTKKTKATYKSLIDALQEYIHYTLDIEEVWYHMHTNDKYVVCIIVWPDLISCYMKGVVDHLCVATIMH